MANGTTYTESEIEALVKKFADWLSGKTLETDSGSNFYFGSDVQCVKDNQMHNLSAKQDQLVSGRDIKTINNSSLLGSGNIDVALASQLTDLENKLSERIAKLEGSTVDNVELYNSTTQGPVSVFSITMNSAVGYTYNGKQVSKVVYHKPDPRESSENSFLVVEIEPQTDSTKYIKYTEGITTATNKRKFGNPITYTAISIPQSLLNLFGDSDNIVKAISGDASNLSAKVEGSLNYKMEELINAINTKTVSID